MTNKKEANSIQAKNKACGTKQVSEVRSAVQLPSAFFRGEIGLAVENAKKPNESIDDAKGSFHEEGGMFGYGCKRE
ncbi:hypothetical protein [Pararhodonellum marinum]|uniref:hypothetical protein n=1 Tax=Pararhodonellum marinum TaxID=2755358 RepID=UPI00188FD634|nr:hypothetical protein [Pararhodonellum marinum]